MNVLQLRHALLFLIIWVFLWALLGMLASWGWALWRLATGRGLLPARPLVRRGPATWRAGTVLLVLLTYVLVAMSVGAGYRWATGARRHARPAAGRAAPKADEHPGDRDLSALEGMGLQSALNALLIVVLPGILYVTSGARPRDLGWSRDDPGRQARVGMVAILLLMPIVYAIQGAAMYWLGPFGEENRHPVEQMLKKDFSAGVAVLAVLGGVVLAPICEEILFRGVLQTWLVRFLGGVEADDIGPASDPSAMIGERPAPSGSEPPSRQASSIATLSAIVLASLIFAAMHAEQWPAPIAIFVLALGLGLVYQRTGSLFSSICMHAVFNGLSTLALFYQLLLGPQPTGRPAAVAPPAVKRAAPRANDKLPPPPRAGNSPSGAPVPAN